MSDTLTLKSIPRPFLILEAAPYLASNPEDAALLQKHFVKLTRQLHPDLLPPDTEDAEREQAESQLAALNAAYLAQRDLKDRVDLLLEAGRENFPDTFEGKNTNKLPPQYAMQYFEIQEALEERPSSPDTLSQLDIFKEELQDLSVNLGTQILKIAQKHPFKKNLLGSSNSDERNTWTLAHNDLEELIGLRGQQKYSDRLIDDLNNFVARMAH